MDAVRLGGGGGDIAGESGLCMFALRNSSMLRGEGNPDIAIAGGPDAERGAIANLGDGFHADRPDRASRRG
jgi:hypothetical protein